MYLHIHNIFPGGVSNELRYKYDSSMNVLVIGKPGLNIAEDFTILIT